jgi:hypothetical protein
LTTAAPRHADPGVRRQGPSTRQRGESSSLPEPVGPGSGGRDRHPPGRTGAGPESASGLRVWPAVPAWADRPTCRRRRGTVNRSEVARQDRSHRLDHRVLARNRKIVKWWPPHVGQETPTNTGSSRPALTRLTDKLGWRGREPPNLEHPHSSQWIPDRADMWNGWLRNAGAIGYVVDSIDQGPSSLNESAFFRRTADREMWLALSDVARVGCHRSYGDSHVMYVIDESGGLQICLVALRRRATRFLQRHRVPVEQPCSD